MCPQMYGGQQQSGIAGPQSMMQCPPGGLGMMPPQGMGPGMGPQGMYQGHQSAEGSPVHHVQGYNQPGMEGLQMYNMPHQVR
jgi:hypothetical protein